MVLGLGGPLDSMQDIREAVEESLPGGATTLIAGDHDDELLLLGEMVAWRFPQLEDGTYAGDPPSGLAAVAQLEALRVRGADFLVLPPSTIPWLEQYPVFKRHLERRYRRIPSRRDVCLIFALRESPRAPALRVVAALEELIVDFQNRFDRDPAILDWSSGFKLAARLPQHAVFSPVDADAVLPYLDRTIDIVVIADEDPIHIAEARRVANGAIVRVDPGQVSAGENDGAVPSVAVEWRTDVMPANVLTVSIVIPICDAQADIVACLMALAETLPKDFRGEVIIAPDSSVGEAFSAPVECGWLTERLKVSRATEDRGFAAACNRGASNAASEVLVFLAHDALTLPGWLEFLLRTFRDHPEAGAVGGKLIYPDGTLQAAGGIVLPDGNLTGLSAGEYEVEHPAYGYVRTVDYHSSVLLATTRSLFFQLAGFDGSSSPDEGVDYCRRLREGGWSIYYQPGVSVVHPIGAMTRTAAVL